LIWRRFINSRRQWAFLSSHSILDFSELHAMPNPFGTPEISVQDVQKKQQAGEALILLDVREPAELQKAYIEADNVIPVPMSEIAARQLEALPEEVQDKDREIVVFCHHGMRSAQVTAWLRQKGWTNVASMIGGIDAWANEIDPDVGTY
jgi:rhodanese-related sulfurtransferase